MASELLHEAITLIRAEKMEDARQIIFDIIRNQPQNEVAWIWLAETFSSDLDRLKVLTACSQNIPDSKIVTMAISKLKRKIDNTGDLSASVNPFIEGGTFDPSARERTGHTGAIIGFDGSFIATDIPDFDEVVDLRAPKTSILHRPGITITKPTTPVDNFAGPAQTAPLNPEEVEEDAKFKFEPSIFVEPKSHQTGELNYEPDLSSFLSDAPSGREKTRKFTEPQEPVPLELPKVMQYNTQTPTEKDKPSPAASIFQPIKAIEVEEPATPFIGETPLESMRQESLAEDSFLKNNYGEDEAPPRKGVRRNVLLVSGLFAVIILLCLVTTLVLSGYSFGARTKTPTLPAIFIGDIIPTEPKLTLPPIVSATPLPPGVLADTATSTYTALPSNTSLPTLTATETPLISTTPSVTRTRTRTQTPTPSATNRIASTNTMTATITQTPTPSNTPQPTNTFTQVNTPTRTLYPTLANTSTGTPIPPTSTPLPPTNTPVPPPTETPTQEVPPLDF